MRKMTELDQVQNGRYLYRIWKERGREQKMCRPWEDFWSFYDWAKEEGWEQGCRIRCERGKELGPDTCRVVPKPEPRKENSPCETCQISKACPGRNCYAWRDWFVGAWDRAVMGLRKISRGEM